LTGATGCGKTTLLQVLAGFRKPEGGSIRFSGSDQPASPLELRRKVSYISRDAMLLSGLRVDEHLRFVTGVRRSDSRIDPAALMSIAHDLGLDIKAPAESLGPPARAALALAAGIATHADAVLVDEALDLIAPGQLDQAVALLAASSARGSALLIATAATEPLGTLRGRTLHLEDGRLSERRPSVIGDELARRDARQLETA
jgi:ABC-type multidrug transport system ATPase subunit